MKVKGKILSAVNDVLTIQVCADAQGWVLDHNAREVEVRIDDGRRITNDQRRKIYATMRDIADWMGDMPDSVKAFFKWSFCGDEEFEDFSLSDDVVQETYIKIMEKSFSYQKGTNVRAWVLAIARNIAIDYYRKRKFECESEEIIDDDTRFDESTVLSSLEVKKALDTLSDEERQIITFKIYAGLKHREIASLLGITTEACKKKYQRAVAKLRELI